MKVLITGANGFSALYLKELISKRNGVELILSDIQGDLLVCDYTDYSAVLNLISETRPDQIYNLIGGFTNNYEIDYRCNVLTTKNILESVAQIGLKCRVFLVGSSAEYGKVSEFDNPVRENHPLNPISLYGLTKVFQTHLMHYYSFTYGLDLVMARPFNLMGKGMSHNLFIGQLYEQIKAYQEGRISKITLGNLESKRDYIDVVDAVEAYELIMNFGEMGAIYNVGSGRSIRIRDLLNRILEENGLTKAAVITEPASKSDRYDVHDIFADISKLNGIIHK